MLVAGVSVCVVNSATPGVQRGPPEEDASRSGEPLNGTL